MNSIFPCLHREIHIGMYVCMAPVRGLDADLHASSQVLLYIAFYLFMTAMSIQNLIYSRCSGDGTSVILSILWIVKHLVYPVRVDKGFASRGSRSNMHGMWTEYTCSADGMQRPSSYQFKRRRSSDQYYANTQ